MSIPTEDVSKARLIEHVASLTRDNYELREQRDELLAVCDYFVHLVAGDFCESRWTLTEFKQRKAAAEASLAKVKEAMINER